MKKLKYLKKFENFEENFGFGDCYIYAIAMHRLYGYPIYGVKLYFKEDDWDELDDPQYDFEYAHIIVKKPNGKFIDDQGEYDEEELKDLCETSYTEFIKIVPISEFEAKTAYLGSDETETIGPDYKEEDIIDVMKIIKENEKI